MINFFIDESGSFVPAEKAGAWNITGAIAVPGPEKRKCFDALKNIKNKSGYKFTNELKLKDIDEQNYIEFLEELRATKCTFYGVVVDSGSVTASNISEHRENQANGVEVYKGKMHHLEGQMALEKLANQIRRLSPQLYVQLICQVELMNELIDRGIMYYVQRIPKQLNGFHWEIDEKSAGNSNFENTFRTVVPPLLQSRSLREPHTHLTDCNYDPMKEYFYTRETMPTYLQKHYDMNPNEGVGLNVSKVVWDDFSFVDSKNSMGVQLADLLSSGLRRCLRNGFHNNMEVCKNLGCLMVQSVNDKPPIRPITLSGNGVLADEDAISIFNTLKAAQKPMLI